MYVDLSSGTAVVRKAEDLKSLSVVSPGGVPDASALGQLGVVEGGHVWLSVSALRAAAAATVPEADREPWIGAFDGMIAYATSKGWTDESGTRVRAHVEATA